MSCERSEAGTNGDIVPAYDPKMTDSEKSTNSLTCINTHKFESRVRKQAQGGGDMSPVSPPIPAFGTNEGDSMTDQGRMTDLPDDVVEAAAEASHIAYEDAALEHGWETQERSRVPWAEVPEENKATVRVAVRAALAAASGPWAEQLDAANAERLLLAHQLFYDETDDTNECGCGEHAPEEFIENYPADWEAPNTPDAAWWAAHVSDLLGRSRPLGRSGPSRVDGRACRGQRRCRGGRMSIDQAESESRWLCDNCDWNGTHAELLTAPHPWHTDSTLFGCPECRWEDELHWACQVCHTQRVTSGTPTPDGYLRTCSDHRPDGVAR